VTPAEKQAQISEAVKRITSSHAFKAAEAMREDWAVVFVGTTKRVPRDFGDNRGWWPVSIGLTKDPEAYIDDINRRQRDEHIILDLVWIENHRHGFKLKAELDVLLLGNNEENRIRAIWRDATVDPDTLWTIILGDALERLRARGESIHPYSKEMRIQKIANAMRGGMR